jgi:hypothetical protein
LLYYREVLSALLIRPYRTGYESAIGVIFFFILSGGEVFSRSETAKFEFNQVFHKIPIILQSKQFATNIYSDWETDDMQNIKAKKKDQNQIHKNPPNPSQTKTIERITTEIKTKTSPPYPNPKTQDSQQPYQQH